MHWVTGHMGIALSPNPLRIERWHAGSAVAFAAITT
jgi:hypothetical protein